MRSLIQGDPYSDLSVDGAALIRRNTVTEHLSISEAECEIEKQSMNLDINLRGKIKMNSFL